ncbi:MAG: hypothetical protein ACK4Z8_07255 [Novosphingobium sp.]
MNRKDKARLAAINTLISELLAAPSDEEEARSRIPTTDELVANAKACVRARRQRQDLFPGIQVADPAWDLMLELFIYDAENRRISVTGLGLAANVPGATVLRWLAMFQEAGLIVREPDALDRRRIWIHLTEAGRERIARGIDPAVPGSHSSTLRRVERSSLAA